jgi:hypothetical protein
MNMMCLCVKLMMNYDMLLLICSWINDYELWLLMIAVVNVISWITYELYWVVVVELC